MEKILSFEEFTNNAPKTAENIAAYLQYLKTTGKEIWTAPIKKIINGNNIS
jgi:hypothetical protein